MLIPVGPDGGASIIGRFKGRVSSSAPVTTPPDRMAAHRGSTTARDRRAAVISSDAGHLEPAALSPDGDPGNGHIVWVRLDWPKD